MIGICFIAIGLAIIFLAIDNMLQNKRIKKLEEQLKTKEQQ